MANSLEYIDLDNLYHSLEHKVLLNNFNHLELDPTVLSDMLYSKYGSEISLKPRCACGYLNRAYLVNKTCPKCGTKVVKEFNVVKPVLWIKAYEEDLPFISPFYYGEIRSLFKKNVDPIRWIIDTGYNPPNIPPMMHNVVSLIGGRGYKNFINNVPKILTYFKNHSTFKYNHKKHKVDKLLELYKTKKELIFSHHLPLINKRLFVMEMTNKGDYTTNMLADIIDIAITAIRISDSNVTTKRLHNGIGAIISKTNILFEKYLTEKVAKKPGSMRKHLYGTRSHFTFRGVITSFSSTLPYDDLHAPWQVLTTAFRPMVLNKLMNKYKMNHRDASELLFDSTLKYNKLIADIGKELIEESKYKGIPVIFNRNPSLLHTSSSIKYITRFKEDPIDTTIGCSILAIKAPNGDFDKQI